MLGKEQGRFREGSREGAGEVARQGSEEEEEVPRKVSEYKEAQGKIQKKGPDEDGE